ncbi:anaerobic sulfatase maturase [Oleiharenicola lentus]|uniref:Anaerobic sulfatase maturase n=1 Tax=Oleiharenicola lentus TaxID=2508720 RepID=A0A4Q1CBP2_9BACT|nr:anaerobic sulfatase maturase [Oleiharenicola lentus]RXK56351.1 anaerobic sulfatase maturase [Oleiharenicola lentus]
MHAVTNKPGVARRPFHLMTKPIGPICNLDCKYCFYLEKEALYQDPKWRMSPELLEIYIRTYISAQPLDNVSFAWQGGEPTLLGVGFFERVVALQQQYAAGKRIENAFQTNGILLDDQWGAFLKAHNFLVGVSVDGPRHLHDAYRVDKGGQPTFDRVMAGLEVLKRHGVEFNTLTTVHRANAKQPREVYQFLRAQGSGYLQFIPIVERNAPAHTADGLWLAPPPNHDDAANLDSQVTPWSVRPGDYGKFLTGVFDEWIKADVGRVFVQHFDSALANWLGQSPGICIFSPTCGRALAIEHNGDVYSCDHYVYPRYRLGNLLNEDLAALVDSPPQEAFGSAKADLPRYCRECPVRFACHGECPKHRFVRTPDGESGLNYLCAAYKKFFTHITPAMNTMAALIGNGRPPADIMLLPRSHWLPN